MPRTDRRFRPSVLSLESREVPALLLQLSPSGTLSALFGVPAGNVTVTQVDDDVFNIDEAGNDLGTYEVAGDLRITLGNTVQALTHVLDFGSFEFNGGVFAAFGNSPLLTTVIVDGDVGAGIAGDLRLTTGNGPDSISIDGVDVACSVTVNANGSSDELSIASGVSIAGHLTITNVQNFELEGDVEGIFQFDASREGLPNDVHLTDSSTIGGITVINTGPRADNVQLDGEIEDHAVIKTGNGNADIDFTGVVLGNLTIVTGNNNDDIRIRGLVGGNLTIITNGGNDTVVFDNGATVLGSFINLQFGAGNDELIINRLNAPGARLMAFMGNGNDEVDLNTVPNVLLAFFDGGFGNNSFSSPGGINFPITKRFF